MIKKLTYFLAAVAALGLTACSDDALSFGDDELAVRFTAAVNGNLSRASSGTPLASGTTVRISNGGDYFGYRADGSGNLLPTDGDFIRWSNMVQSTMEISAYSPATEGTSLTSFTVPTDQSTADGLANADYATFQGTVDRIGDTNDVTFTLERHQSQVNVLISDVDEDYKDCIFDVTIYSDGTPIKPYNGENITTGSTATAIIAPNEADANAKFIAVQVKDAMGENVGEPLIALGTPDLTAGNSYTFRLTVHNEALTIASVTLTDWANLTLTGGEADLAHEGDLYIYLQDYDTAADVRARIKKYCAGTAIHKNVYISGRLGDWSLKEIVGCDYYWEPLAVENLNLDEITDLEALPDTCFLMMESLVTISATQITRIGDTSLNDCENLTSVNFPNATSVEYQAFNYCPKLTSLYLPKVTYIGEFAFCNCRALTSLYIPSATNIEFSELLYGVTTTNIDLTVNSCWAEKISGTTLNGYTFRSITIDNDITVNLDYISAATDVYNLISGVCADSSSDNEVTMIGSIGSMSLAGMIGTGNSYSSRRTLSIEKLDLTGVSGLTSIPDYCCFRMSSLKSISASSEVTTISYEAFDECTSLTTVDIPNIKVIDYFGFEDCSSLSYIDLSNVESVGLMGLASTKITTANMPKATKIDDRCFEDCTALQEVYLPLVTTLNYWTFRGCTSLTSIYMPRLTDIDETKPWTPFEDCPTQQIDLTINVALQSRVTNSTLLLYYIEDLWSDELDAEPVRENVKVYYTFKSITLVPDYDYYESGGVD